MLEIITVNNNIRLSGILTETIDISDLESKLRQAAEAGSGEVVVDFRAVERANSIGLKYWVDSINGLKVAVAYVNSPEWLVCHFNMLMSLFPAGSRVISFDAPYFLERDPSEIEFFTLHVGKDIPVSISDDYTPPPLTRGKDIYLAAFDPIEYLDFLSFFEGKASLDSD